MDMQNSLWERLGNHCLQKALKLLESETTPTDVTVRVVRELTETAIAIDSLNLRWQQQNRYGAAVFRGRPSSRQEGEN